MANKYLNSSILDKAIVFAVKAHANTERRGKGFPYIVHPMEAVEIVSSMTADQELLAAAALHDTVEDTGVTLEQIRLEFGDRVAKLVEEESDVFMEGVSASDSWHSRKEAAINRLMTASRDAKMVALGDKLSNARAIYRDFMQKGDELWKIFHVTDVSEHEWHYRGLVRALSDLSGTFAFAEFAQLVTKIFGEPKPEPIDLKDYEESGDGYTAISYNHKDGQKMMKLYAPFIPETEARQELSISWNIMDLGIRIPKAYRLVTDGERIGVEFERIVPKKSFSRSISDEPQRLEFFAGEFARETKKLHQTPCNTKAFAPTESRFKKAVENSKILSETQRAKILEFIDSVPAATTCIHGDLHIGNILTNGKENFWIDLSAFAYGNPLFDLGMLYFVTHFLSEEEAQRIYHISKQQILDVWNIFAKNYFEGEDEPEAIDTKVKPFALLPMLYFAGLGKVPNGTEQLTEEIFGK